MGLLFKIAGLLVILAVCTAFGYEKSHSIRKRAGILNFLHRATTLLAEYIKSDGGEISKLLPRCFGDDFVKVNDNELNFKKDFLEKSDIDLLKEFFEGLGFGDKNSEYERTKLFVALIKKQSEEANMKAESLCKLYNTVGFLSGVFVCIFFL